MVDLYKTASYRGMAQELVKISMAKHALFGIGEAKEPPAALVKIDPSKLKKPVAPTAEQVAKRFQAARTAKVVGQTQNALRTSLPTHLLGKIR